MQTRGGGQYDMVQVALPLPVAEHGIEPKFLKNQVAFAIYAANDAGDRFGNGVWRGLDKLRPMVDPVMHLIKVAVPASGLHGYHGLEFPIVLGWQPYSLPVRDGPEDRRIDSTPKVRMQFGPRYLCRLRHARFYFSRRRATIIRAIII